MTESLLVEENFDCFAVLLAIGFFDRFVLAVAESWLVGETFDSFAVLLTGPFFVRFNLLSVESVCVLCDVFMVGNAFITIISAAEHSFCLGSNPTNSWGDRVTKKESDQLLKID